MLLPGPDSNGQTQSLFGLAAVKITAPDDGVREDPGLGSEEVQGSRSTLVQFKRNAKG